MKILKPYVILALVILVCSCSPGGEFVTVRNGRFRLEGKPYSYVGTNFWYGAILGSPGEGGDRERLIQELDLLHSVGLDNLRILVGGDGHGGIPSRIEPALQIEAGVYNQDLFEGLDYLLAEMGRRKMKAVLYLNNSWEWSGGYSQYLEWAGRGKAPIPAVDGWSSFFEYVGLYAKDSLAHALFYDHVRTVVSRTNSVTGLKYTEDPAIMAWQIGNEPRPFGPDNHPAFIQWLAETSALIRNLDRNHLICTGNEGRAGSDESLELVRAINSDPNIDYMTIHIWPLNWGWIGKGRMDGENLELAKSNTMEYIRQHKEIAADLGLPVVLEEFGFPRDSFCFTPGSPTSCRDEYYSFVMDAICSDASSGGQFAGCNFWGWGGYATPSTDHIFWEKGDPYCGDPAQEEQGLNSIFAKDSTTLAIISSYAAKL